jgi:6-phosphogluconolactonase
VNSRVHVATPYTDALLPRFLDLVNEPGEKFIALSGGRTPREFFTLLATAYRKSVPWDRIEYFQVDERCVPPDHLDSNWRQIRETIVDVVPEAQAHRIRAENAHGAEGYETLIRAALPQDPAGVPVFDLVLLGLGADGHTASLFPGTRALAETQRAVVRNPVPQLNTERITMTLPLLNAARHRWFILRGADRGDIFQQVQAGLHPAGRIRDPEWFVEHDVLAS